MNRTKTTLRKIISLTMSVCMMPTVTPLSVAAEDGQILGMITAFEPLADDIRMQRTNMPVLSKTLAGTVGGEPADIPVTWLSTSWR